MRYKQTIEVGKNNINMWLICFGVIKVSQCHAAAFSMEHCWLQKLMFLAEGGLDMCQKNPSFVFDDGQAEMAPVFDFTCWCETDMPWEMKEGKNARD